MTIVLLYFLLQEGQFLSEEDVKKILTREQILQIQVIYMTNNAAPYHIQYMYSGARLSQTPLGNEILSFIERCP